MGERVPLLPPDWRARIGYAAGSAMLAAVALSFVSSGVFAWNTLGYWLFVGAVFCLGFAISTMLD